MDSTPDPTAAGAGLRRGPQRKPGPTPSPAPRPFRVLAVASNKGGVGKTTVAANLAVYLRALRPGLPVLLLGFDDQTVIDRMFGLDGDEPDAIASALRAGDLRPAIRAGLHGVHYVPSSPAIAELKRELPDPFVLQAVLRRTAWRGLVVVDTKGDLEILTQNAIAASDLAIVVVSDHSSVVEAEKAFRLLDAWGMPRTHARILLSLVDLRVKFRESDRRDVLALLLSEIRQRGYPVFQSFLSRSPRIEALATNLEGRALPILHHARGSLIHRQMRALAEDVLALLGTDALALSPEVARVDPAPATVAERRQRTRHPYARQVAAFQLDAPPLALVARDLSRGGMRVEPAPALAVGRRLHVALQRARGEIPFLVWAWVTRAQEEGAALAFEPLDTETAARLEALLDSLPAPVAASADTAPERRGALR